ncbi:MAG TPA: hypothetical protein VHC97_13860 [Thermoanaerobaculia bacterium]|jgi:hypothetical protein|nr:hypothetical protein [Thermoanaerobaculia bacterium]
MSGTKKLAKAALAALIAASMATTASATTLVRAGLDRLVTSHSKIVVGQVVEAHSYWNQEGNFILTDVRFAATDVLKGRLDDQDFTITLLGGQVGDLTTIIVGGAELVPGNSYVLFLNEQNLPGARGALTVREHVQGAFDLKKGKDGNLRAVSQAVRHSLLPDEKGLMEPPGGAEGLLLKDMIRSIRDITARPGHQREVQ